MARSCGVEGYEFGILSFRFIYAEAYKEMDENILQILVFIVVLLKIRQSS